GAACQHPLPPRGGRADGASAHAQRVGRGDSTNADRDSREQSATGWLGGHPAGPAAVHARRGAHRGPEVARQPRSFVTLLGVWPLLWRKSLQRASSTICRSWSHCASAAVLSSQALKFMAVSPIHTTMVRWACCSRTTCAIPGSEPTSSFVMT